MRSHSSVILRRSSDVKINCFHPTSGLRRVDRENATGRVTEGHCQDQSAHTSRCMAEQSFRRGECESGRPVAATVWKREWPKPAETGNR